MGAMSIRALNWKIRLFAFIGLSLSVYALNVETKVENDENYEAMCDIHEHMSCTKAFSSEYGKGFGLIPSDSIFFVPNSVYGILHYFMVLLFSFKNTSTINFFLLVQIILSNFASMYFAYILYFILADFCIVCVATYIVNAALLMYTFAKYSTIPIVKTKLN